MILPAKRPVQATQFSPTWSKDWFPQADTVSAERHQERHYKT